MTRCWQQWPLRKRSHEAAMRLGYVMGRDHRPEAGPRELLDAAAMSDIVTAAFDGRCVHCQEPICEGDLIVLVDGDWVHEDCEQEA
jgi:hypothetical protein